MKEFCSLLKKDMQCLVRSPHVVVATFFFALVVVVVASFSFRRVGISGEELKAITPGVLWIVFLFTAVIGLNYSFVPERSRRALQAVLLSPVSSMAVYAAKVITNLLFLLLVQSFVLAAHGLLFGAELFPVYAELFFLSLLVSLGFVSLGTLLAAIAAMSQGKELVLPLLLFPLTIPLLAGAVFTSRVVLETGGIPWSSFWFVLIIVWDVIAVTLSVVLFDYAVRD